MRLLAVAITILITMAQCAVAGQMSTSFPLPEGWHEATLKDVVKDNAVDLNNRKEHPTYYLQAIGDFDGNGLQDIARLLISNDGKSAEIYITMHNRGGTFTQIPFWRVGNVSDGEMTDLYIENAPPGTYQNIEYSEGDHNQVPSVVTTHDGFAYGKFEST